VQGAQLTACETLVLESRADGCPEVDRRDSADREVVLDDPILLTMTMAFTLMA